MSSEVADHQDRLDAVEAELADVCGVLNVAHGRLVELTAQAIEGELWRGWGIRSVEHWLSIRAGLSRSQAARVVTIARRRSELPVTMDSLHDGALTLDQAVAVAALTPAHADAEAAEVAAVCTVTQLRSALTRHRYAEQPTGGAGDDDAAGGIRDDRPQGGVRENGQEGSGGLPSRPDVASGPGRVRLDTDGPRFGLWADLPVDDGAVVEQALREAKDALFGAGQPDVTWSDALLEVCRRSLAAPMSTGRAEQYRTWIHLDVTGGWLNQGPTLPSSLLDKLLCDGVVQPLWIREGVPISVGRSTRVIPRRLRRLVLDRDRTCIVPGCGARHHLEVHHVRHWVRGGSTDLANLVALCPAHHDAHHRGDFTISGDASMPGALRFHDRLGQPLCRPVQPRPPQDGLATASRGHGYRPPSGERIHHKWISLPAAPRMTPLRT